MTVFNYVTDTITAIGVVIAAFGLLINMRGTYLVTMHKCIKEYRDIVRKMQDGDFKNEETVKKDLLGLFNEQLYYYGKWYLPRGIRKEWKDSMLRHLTNKDTTIITFAENDWKEFHRVKTFMEHATKGSKRRMRRR